MQLTNIYKNGHAKMMNTVDKLNNAIQQIIPHLSESTSGIINKIGIVSLTTGGTNAIVTTAIETQNETWLSISDFYYARRKDHREQELHDKAMHKK